MSLEACLPPELRGPGTTITRVGVGQSGAGVYRVDAGGRSFALKIAAEHEPLATFRRKVETQRRAADAGVAPRLVHVDDERRAALSVFVADRSFPAYYGDPRTRDEALVRLGRAIRRTHELPLSDDAAARDPRDVLAAIWASFPPGFALPPYVGDAVRGVLADEPPPSDRAPVLSHNDVNPSNVAYDGEDVVLLDWDTAGPNDPFYDLAAISVFLRMDEATCRKLLAAYDGSPPATLPARFAHSRRVVAVLCGAAFLHVARQTGHPGATGDESVETALSLGDVYQRMRAGAVSLATPDGRWTFGLALVKEGVALTGSERASRS